jgi:hypothetical protein
VTLKSKKNEAAREGMRVLREKRRELGMIRPEVWIPARDLGKLRKYVARLVRIFEREKKNEKAE